MCPIHLAKDLTAGGAEIVDRLAELTVGHRAMAVPSRIEIDIESRLDSSLNGRSAGRMHVQEYVVGRTFIESLMPLEKLAGIVPGHAV
jgi:hypothetical protein